MLRQVQVIRGWHERVPPRKSVYYRGFDGLRAISIAFVLLTHLGLYHSLNLPYKERWFQLVSGAAGVQVFFVLSGFLITDLLLREKRRSQTVSLRKFYIRRCLRIIPCFAVFLLVVAFIAHFSTIVNFSRAAWLFTALYLYNFTSRANYSGVLGHTWSLAVEEHFYLVWPLLAKFVPAKRLLITTCVLIIVMVGVKFGVLRSEALTSRFFPDRWTVPAAIPILVGCSLALLLTVTTRRRYLHLLQEKKILAVGGLLYVSPMWVPHVLFPALSAVQAVGIALVLSWILQHPDALVTSLLEMRPVAFIGRISYGIYIWQGFFLMTGPGTHSNRLWAQMFPQNIILTLTTAMISYFFIEAPFLRLKDRFSRIHTRFP
jgi:peptidoglycan/LPS O-acetylase OafA/YrhL